MRNLFTVVFRQIKVLYCVWIASVISQCMFVCISMLFWVVFFGNRVCMTLAQRLWRKRFLKTPNANFHSFVTNSPMKWTCPFIWKNWKSFSKGWLYHVCCLTLTQRIWRRFLKHSTMCFPSFLINFPLIKISPFFSTKLKALPPKMLCVLFSWNWSCGPVVLENKIFKTPNFIFPYFVIISPFEG